MVDDVGIEPTRPKATELQSAETPLFRVIQESLKEYILYPINQSMANQNFGIPREIRTPTKGFGDPYAAITLARYWWFWLDSN